MGAMPLPTDEASCDFRYSRNRLIDALSPARAASRRCKDGRNTTRRPFLEIPVGGWTWAALSPLRSSTALRSSFSWCEWGIGAYRLRRLDSFGDRRAATTRA